MPLNATLAAKFRRVKKTVDELVDTDDLAAIQHGLRVVSTQLEAQAEMAEMGILDEEQMS